MAGSNAEITRVLLHTAQEELPEQPVGMEEMTTLATGSYQ